MRSFTDWITWCMRTSKKEPMILLKQQVDYLLSINEVDPVTFKTAYAFAASPSRYLLERKMWKEAADLEIHPAVYPWDKFPWQKAIFHFTRVLGSVHTNDLKKATTELETLKSLYAILQKNKNKANEAAQVLVQIKASEAWIEFKQGSKEKAIVLMTTAANMEDRMAKHPVTPGEVIPIREQLGELLLEMNKPVPALTAFEANLKTHANRFNSLYGAGMAARKSGNNAKAKEYFDKLLKIVGENKSPRIELISE